MNFEKSQSDLYYQLMALCESTDRDAFYYQDFSSGNEDEYTYRIFNYRLASYTDFLQPGAIEARGIMFRVSSRHAAAEPLELVCRPMAKFFNYSELQGHNKWLKALANASAAVARGELSVAVYEQLKDEYEKKNKG